ncbi:DUF3999 family protein [Desulfovibrio porci]|uniref:DUF3999 family protein n=1 Tax=Desulfovibrio porci TaxID=2605782 RepID=UPI003A93A521
MSFCFSPSRLLLLPALTLVCLTAATATATEQELTPRDFSTLIPIEAKSGSPVYRLDLPFAVYERSRLSPLRDVRVFNSLGRAEAIYISPAESRPEPTQEQAFPCFTQWVRSGGTEGIVLLRDGQSASETPPAPEGQKPEHNKNRVATARSLLVDFGQKRPRFERVRLVPRETPGGETRDQDGGMLSTRLYTSADMQSWIAEGRQTLGQMRMDGQAVELLDLPADRISRRYMLLVPAEGGELFPIQEVRAREKVRDATPVDSIVLRGLEDEKAGGFSYALPRGLPVINLEPEPAGNDNFLLRGRILTPALRADSGAQRRPRRQLPPELVWQERAPFSYYELRDAHSRNTVRADPVPFDRRWLSPENNDPLLRDAPATLLLRLGGDIVKQPPALRVRWAGQQLYFMAGGPGPYTLAVGSLKAGDLAGTRDAALRELPVAAGPARLNMAELREQTPPPAYDETPGGQRWLLWGVLLLGAAAMAFMAAQLLRKPEK